MDPDPQTRPLLARRLDQLFRAVLLRTDEHPEGREYKPGEVAELIQQRGGPAMTAQYIWALRRGERDNPTLKNLQGLADFFDVQVSYFTDEDERGRQLEEELSLVAALRDAKVRGVARRAVGVSSGSLDLIRAMLDKVRHLEGLPDESPTSDD